MRQGPRRERPLVLHVTTTDISLDLLLLPQLRALASAGYGLAAASAPGPHVARLAEHGIVHYSLESFTRSSNPFADLRSVAELVRLVRRLQPDIVHTHNPKPGVIGRPVARLLGVPLVVNTQHGLYAQPGDRRRRRWPVYAAERFAAAFSHIELVQSSEDVDTLVQRLRVPADKVRLLGNGVDLARFDPVAVPHHARHQLRQEWGVGDGDVLIGAVCRLTREKGIEELLAAFETVREHCPNAHFVVIGPDESSDDLAPAINAARIAGIVFTGLRTDMPECYAAMDLFVTASWREGVPRSAMEASAMRLPIVATDIRGCRQVVDTGTTGTLVPVRHPAALAEAISQLVNDAELRHRYGTAAQARAQAEFDDRRVIERTLEAYRLLGH